MPPRRKTGVTMGITKNKRYGVAFTPLYHLLIGMALFAVLNHAAAHDPGLSKVTIDVAANHLSAQLVFARQDIEQQIPMDTDAVTGISSTEFRRSEQNLISFIGDNFQVVAAGQYHKADVANVWLDESEAVHFKLSYSNLPIKKLTIRSNYWSQFGLGHRQFVTIHSADGTTRHQWLSVNNTEFTLDIPKPSWRQIIVPFVLDGIWHIWIGYDHILFLVTMLLPLLVVGKQSDRYGDSLWKPLSAHAISVVTAFTLAHSITLALSVYDIIQLPSTIVEAVIALSVMIAACNNIFGWTSRYIGVMAFVFGLVHGMGFATVLREIGMHEQRIWALVGFNLGVELGQLAILATVLPALFICRKMNFYASWFMKTGSWATVAIAAVWLFQRTTPPTWLHLTN